MFDFSSSPAWFEEELNLRLGQIGAAELYSYEPANEQLPGDIYISFMNLSLIQVWILLQIELEYRKAERDNDFLAPLENFWLVQLGNITEGQVKNGYEISVRSEYLLVFSPIIDNSEQDAVKSLSRDFRFQSTTRKN